MSTHGVFVIKIGDVIYGFHVTRDGNAVQDFYNTCKDLTDGTVIFQKALDFFAEEYDDAPHLNFYMESFNPEEDYSNITEYTCYFDGQQWFKDWSE